jgi:hypothetical protein
LATRTNPDRFWPSPPPPLPARLAWPTGPLGVRPGLSPVLTHPGLEAAVAGTPATSSPPPSPPGEAIDLDRRGDRRRRRMIVPDSSSWGPIAAAAAAAPPFDHRSIFPKIFRPNLIVRYIAVFLTVRKTPFPSRQNRNFR